MLNHYVDSLNKMKSFEHTKIAPGHFEMIDNPQNRVEQILLHHEKRSEKIINILKDGELTDGKLRRNYFRDRLMQ